MTDKLGFALARFI